MARSRSFSLTFSILSAAVFLAVGVFAAPAPVLAQDLGIAAALGLPGFVADAKAPAPKILLIPKSVNFGKLSVPGSATAEVFVANIGDADLQFTSITAEASKGSTEKGDTVTVVPSASSCPVAGGTLPTFASCVVTVQMDIAATAKGGASGDLIFSDNSPQGKGTEKVSLHGSGNPKLPAPTPTPTPVPVACATPAPGACPLSGPPAISSLAPSSAVAGGPDFSLSVCGCNFPASSTVQWNGEALTTGPVSANQLSASVPAADTANVGEDLVTVSGDSQTSAPETFFVGSTGGNGYAELVVSQQSNDLVNDPLNRVIYLSVPGNVTPNGNTIAVLDLGSGQISSTQFAGSEPDVLAISDDSQFLYAGIDGAASVQRFTLPSLTPDISYSLGSDSFFGPYFALDLQVAPGEPHTTAVTLANMGVSPAAQGGIEIFDDSTPRPTIAPGGIHLYDSLQWGSDATALYAANNETSSFDFYVLSVDSSGVTLDHDYSSAFSKYGPRIHFDADTKLIYSDDGHVVDPSTGNPVGVYPALNGVMVPDSGLNKAFFVSQSGSAITIQSFNLTQFNLTGSITIPGVSGRPDRIIRWGDNGLAIGTFQGPVYLVGGNFVH